MPSGRGGDKSITDADELFAELNYDGDPSSIMNGNEDAERHGGAAGGGGGGGGDLGAPSENGLPEEPPDSSPPSRQGPKNADDNPFSFTKFLQGQVPFPSMDLISPSVPSAQPASNPPFQPLPHSSRPEVKTNGDIFDASTPFLDDPAPKKEKSSEENKARANDDNPFSFKKFLNSAPDAVVTRPKVKVNSTLANGHQLNSVFDPAVPPDLASGLPSSSLLHSSSGSSSSSSSIASRLVEDRLRTSETLPDFAVDSSSSRRRFSTPSPTTPSPSTTSSDSNTTSSGAGGRPRNAASSAAPASTSARSRVDMSRNSIPETLDSSASPVPPVMTLPASPRSFSSPLLNAKGVAARAKTSGDDDVAYPQEIKEVKGSLPDFLSEAAEALNAASVDSPEREPQDRQVPLNLPSFPSTPSPEDVIEDALTDDGNASSATLRRELTRERRRVEELEKKLERMKIADRQTTDSLEKMIQNVERNLDRTTSRAVAAEATNARLEEEAKKMRRRIEFLEKENARLGGVRGCDTPQSRTIAKQIVASADNAEEMLKKLLIGVESVRSLGHTLASMQKFEDVTPEEIGSKSKRFSPSAEEEIEEIRGASGGACGVDASSGSANFGGSGSKGYLPEENSSEALWLNFDAEDVEEQFLLSSDLEKTKNERKTRKDPP